MAAMTHASGYRATLLLSDVALVLMDHALRIEGSVGMWFGETPKLL